MIISIGYRKLMAAVAVLASGLAAGCESVEEPGAGGTPTGSPTAGATAVPVDVCGLVDLALLRDRGVAVETTYQSTDGGLFPSDSCPLFPADEEGTRGSLGDLAVAMTPTPADEFAAARDRLDGEQVSGLGDEAFTVARAGGSFPGGGEQTGLYARAGELVVSLVRVSEEIPPPARVALLEAALGRLPTRYPFAPDAWPPECDRLDRELVAALLDGPVRATRGGVDDRNTSCKLFTAPGWLAVYYRLEPSTLETGELERVPGIAAEAYLADSQVAHVLAGEREAFVDVWLPGTDLGGAKSGPFPEPVRPALADLLQQIADTLTG